MNAENTIFLSGLFSPLLIFMFFRQWLDNKESWLTLIKISSGLAAIAICLNFYLGTQEMFLSFIVPLYSISIYRPLFDLFSRKIKRQPIDTTMDWRPGLFYDRLFNISYCILATIIPLVGLLILTSVLEKTGTNS